MKKLSLIAKTPSEELKKIVENSDSFKEIARKIGYKTTSGGCVNIIKRFLIENNYDFSHFTHYAKTCKHYTKDNVFIENSTASNNTIRRYYTRGHYTEYKCAICGQEPFWNGKPLIMILDHINGNHYDNVFSNLQILCPNCHSIQKGNAGANAGNYFVE